MARNGQVTIEGTDTVLSKACDELLERKAELVNVRAAFNASEENVIELMKKSGKKSVKHEGHIIRCVHTEEKDKVQIQTE